jgi:hypothetical protein
MPPVIDEVRLALAADAHLDLRWSPDEWILFHKAGLAQALNERAFFSFRCTTFITKTPHVCPINCLPNDLNDITDYQQVIFFRTKTH